MIGEREKVVSLSVAGGVLLIGLIYVLAYVYLVPYPGFNYDGQWRIVSFATDCSAGSSYSQSAWCQATKDLLMVEDRVKAIANPRTGSVVTFEDYDGNLFLTPFAGFHPGDSAELTVERDGQERQVRWPIQGPVQNGPLRRLAGLLIFLPFWLAGTGTLLFLRPRDTRWYLLILFNYVTGLWLVTGTASVSQILGSSLLLAAFSWLMMPLYLHLHLLMTAQALSKNQRRVFAALYSVSVVLMLFEAFQIVPVRGYYLALLVAVVGSVGILFVRLLRPSTAPVRAATGLMLTGIGLAILPGTLLWLIPIMIGAEAPPTIFVTALSTLAVPILPLFYFYALYKHRLGNLEVRANRALTNYSFLILFATFFVLAFVLINRHVAFDSSVLISTLLLSVFFLLVATVVRPSFERFINRLAYGTTYDPERIVQQFANEIPRALNPQQLAMLLANQVMPSLLIRQSVLMWLVDGEVRVVYREGVQDLEETLRAGTVGELLARAGHYVPEGETSSTSFAWVRLVIPIAVDGRSVGIWLLGRRDPDDFYPQRDIELLMTLGNQIGVGLETARLFEIQRQRTEELEKAYLKLRRADRLKAAFMRNISHELRTPLTAITGFIDLLMDGGAGELSDEQRDMLQIVADGATNLKCMINDIITFQETRLRRDEGQVLNLADIATTAVRHAQLMAEKESVWQARPHEIVLDCQEGLPAVWANSAQMGQVFNNLLQNAVKFSPEGGQVLVHLYRGLYCFSRPEDSTDNDQAADTEKDAVFVSVIDEGIGIPEGEFENIWMDFYQVDDSATRRFGGTGLGLALVKDIVEAHGGTIWVESAVGEGATFTFVIPAHTAATDGS